MMDLQHIFDNNSQWVADKLAIDPTYFETLAKGQQPDLLYIGCSDSRVSAEELMGVQPGEVFVHRNIANMVISTDNNINAVVQYAVEHLKVKHIIVCGHFECGGVKAALHPSDMGQLNSWLQTLRDVYRFHHHELDSIANDNDRFDRLVELNVMEQCLNIIKIDHVQRSLYATGFPHIHGWVFNVRTGKLKDLKDRLSHDFRDKIADLRPIYDLGFEKE